MEYNFNSEMKKLTLQIKQKFGGCVHLNCKELICERFIIAANNQRKKVFKFRDDKTLISLFSLFE